MSGLKDCGCATVASGTEGGGGERKEEGGRKEEEGRKEEAGERSDRFNSNALEECSQ